LDFGAYEENKGKKTGPGSKPNNFSEKKFEEDDFLNS
jgi:hypothetical protein